MHFLNRFALLGVKDQVLARGESGRAVESLINLQIYLLARELPLGVTKKQAVPLSKEILDSEVGIVLTTHGNNIKSSCKKGMCFLQGLFFGGGNSVYLEKNLDMHSE